VIKTRSTLGKDINLDG